MLTGINAVIFDLDGTLVDSMWVWSRIDVEFLGKYGIAVPAGLQNDLEGMSFTETAVYFKKRFSLSETVDEIKKIWRDMAMDAYCHSVPLKTGAHHFITYLKEKNIRLAVASSNAYELIDAVLKSHGIRDHFDCIITSCQVNRGKPAPDVYLEAARQLKTQVSRCLVFEDIIPGIQAGKNAGMRVCAVDDLYSRPQEKEKKKAADYFITSYEQVIDGSYEET